jgi:hypothetical protein
LKHNPHCRRRWFGLIAALVGAVGCGGAPSPTVGPATSPAAALALLASLADDSLEGRATGKPGATKAARIIAAEMARIGLVPAGDSGYFQRVPVVIGTRRLEDRELTGPMVASSLAALDSFPFNKQLPAVNVLGLIEGGDPTLAGEHLVVSAHYDHIGIRAPVEGDSINNGADDDASGVVAVLKVAEQLARGAKPRRTIYFAAWIGEEAGGLGARWYSDHPARPLTGMVANLQIEMIGRPDTAAGGPGRAWLTGYERSTMGEILAAGGVPIGPDRRPAQNFFRRSDNYRFATLGVVAHTLSSYNMHADYHRPSDEVDQVDAVHLARVIDATTMAVRLLANGPKPEWKPGGRPPAPTRRNP